jgi:signal transduction histidine kinase
MTDSELVRVFERHYRGSEQGGAGIGLSLVKRICQRYNWTIDISSKAGVGTMIRMAFGRHKPGKG